MEFTIDIDKGKAIALAAILESEAVAHDLPSGKRARAKRGGGYGPTARPRYIPSFNEALNSVASQIREQVRS